MYIVYNFLFVIDGLLLKTSVLQMFMLVITILLSLQNFVKYFLLKLNLFFLLF